MSTNNFQKREVQKKDRRQDMQLGGSRARQLEQNIEPPNEKHLGTSINPKTLEDSMMVQGVIEQFRNPMLTKEEEEQTPNENRKIDLRLARQVEAARQLQELGLNTELDPEALQMAQQAMQDYNLDQYMESVGLAQSLSDLAGVAQGFTENQRDRRTTGDQFQQGINQVKGDAPELTSVCKRLGEYLPMHREYLGDDMTTKSEQVGKKAFSKKKLEDGRIVTITLNDIKDNQGNTLAKPGFSNDPRSIGNVSQSLKRMLLDPDGVNDQQTRQTNQGLSGHSSELIRDTYSVALNSIRQISPQRYQNLGGHTVTQNITNNQGLTI